MSDETSMNVHGIQGKHWGSGRVQWLLLIAPLAIAYFQQQVAYALVSWSCVHTRALAHLPTVASLVLLGFVSLASWRRLNEAGVQSVGDERSSDARARFMAVLSLTLCSFVLLLIVAQWLPAAIIDPCQR